MLSRAALLFDKITLGVWTWLARTVDLNRIIGADPDQVAKWLKVCREEAARDPLIPLPDCHVLVGRALNHGVANFLGSGAFSHIYAIDEHRVLKFSRDLTSLKIMERLCSRSDYFARIEQVFEGQARDQEGCIFHAAIVERLQIGYPKWIRSVVTG